MAILNPQEPLWLPPGSVRAIIAIILVAVFAVVAIRSAITIEAKDLVTIVILVLGFYFIAKAATAAKDTENGG
jgi:tryptophan-rich sensory protein